MDGSTRACEKSEDRKSSWIFFHKDIAKLEFFWSSEESLCQFTQDSSYMSSHTLLSSLSGALGGAMASL